MSDFIIIDTDILIDIGRGDKSAIEYLENLEDETGLAISAVTEMERFLRRFEILKLNEQISAEAVELLREYRLSHGLLIADAIIAATVIVYNLPFVSKNQKDYHFIEKLNLISYP